MSLAEVRRIPLPTATPLERARRAQAEAKEAAAEELAAIFAQLKVLAERCAAVSDLGECILPGHANLLRQLAVRIDDDIDNAAAIASRKP
jgi:hypothetical protein